MADAVTNTLLAIRPLSTADAAGLLADVRSVAGWQPSHVVRSQDALDTNIALPAAIAANGDVWRVRFNLDATWPGAIFIPVRFHGEFYSNAGTKATVDAFFDKDFAWSTTKWRSGGVEGQGTYRVDVMSNAVNRVAAASPTFSVGVQPSMAGFPAWPIEAQQSAQMAELAFEVAAFDATVAGGLFLAWDAAWLVYPRSAIRSAGLYVPEQFVAPQ